MAGITSEDVARRLTDAFAAYNRKDIGPYIAMLDPTYVALDPMSPEPIIKSREEARRTNEGLLKSFPDINFKTLRVAAMGDTVAVEFIFSGTFKGPFEVGGRSIPPTGRHFEVKGATFFGFNSKGLLTEGRNYYDSADFFKQLGLKM